jgi:hypothetical protein
VCYSNGRVYWRLEISEDGSQSNGDNEVGIGNECRFDRERVKEALSNRHAYGTDHLFEFGLGL